MPDFMTTLRAGAIALSAAAALALSSAALADDDARDVARDIYRKVERACERSGRAPYNLAEIVEHHFLPELRVELDRAYRNGQIDFDILIDAQDCNIRDVDLDGGHDHDDERGGRPVVVTAKFRNYGERRAVDLVMVRTRGGWKVADIVYRHRAWSLRQNLAYAGGK